MVQGFCPLKVEITQFSDGFRLNLFHCQKGPKSNLDYNSKSQQTKSPHFISSSWSYSTWLSSLQYNYCNQGHLDKVDQSDYRKIRTHSKKLVVGQSAAPKKTISCQSSNLNIDSKRFTLKQTVSPDNVFLFETSSQETYLFDTSCYFVIYQQFLHYHCCTLQ